MPGRRSVGPMQAYRALSRYGGDKRKIKFTGMNKSKRNARTYPSSAAAQFVKKVVDADSEKKEVDTYLSQTDLITNGVLLLNGVAEGDTELTRDGKLVKSKKIQYRVACAARPTTTVVNHGFWAIILDRQPNGADPTVTGVYDTTTVTDVTLAPRNNANLERYKVLKRENFDLGIYSGSDAVMSWDGQLDLSFMLRDEKDQVTRYSGTGATIASLRTNSIYFIYAVSGQSRFGEATNYANITAGFKYQFVDH